MESIEIVVVDDGSPQPDAVARVVEGTGARLVRRPEAGGVAAARNEGVRAAHEPFVCFTDDDCEAAPEWAQRMLRAFDSGADAVTGTTANGCPDNPFDTVSSSFRTIWRSGPWALRRRLPSAWALTSARRRTSYALCRSTSAIGESVRNGTGEHGCRRLPIRGGA